MLKEQQQKNLAKYVNMIESNKVTIENKGLKTVSKDEHIAAVLGERERERDLT